MKLRTFDSSKIRAYMESSPELETGIRYMQHISPGISREAAKESAIRIAIEKCERRWYNDTTGYIANEFIAFQEFEKDVKAKRYFYVKGMKSADEEKQHKIDQANKWEKERERVRKLKKYCEEKGLDFNAENKKAIKRLKVRSVLGGCVIAFTFIPAVVLFLASFVVDENELLMAGIAIGGALLGFLAGGLLLPDVPEDFFKKIKDGSYKFNG